MSVLGARHPGDIGAVFLLVLRAARHEVGGE